MGRAQVLGLAGPVACACVAQQESNDLLDLLTYVQYLLTHVLPRPSFSPPKLLLSQPAVSLQKVAARIATGPLTVAQHKQRIGAASLKVSAAPLPSASRPLVQRLHDSPGILMRDSRPPASKEAH